MGTIAEILRAASQELHGYSDAPQLDAERLLMHVLDHDESSWLITHGNEMLTAGVASEFSELVRLRAKGKPLAYLLGYQEFYGRRFTVNKHVLIPRPTTEDLIDEALMVIQKLARTLNRPLVIADVGTGSGCMAITLALESLEIEKIYATDISPAALRVARYNAVQHGVERQIEFLEGDMLQPLQNVALDLVVSNPPYVPTTELEKSFYSPSAETIGLQHEPSVALDGGTDGQLFIQILKTAGVPAVIEGQNGVIETVR